MHVKTFQGTTNSAVMAKIKNDLGPDAVILSTQTKTVGGRKICEVMAALESDMPANEQPTNNPPPAQGNMDWQAMQREWAELREQCLSVLRPKMDLDQLPSKQRQVIQYLEKEGVSSHCLFTIWKRLVEDVKRSPLHVLGGIMKTNAWMDSDASGTIHALAGPYGCGKTSTLLRIALAMKRNTPSAKICIANGDHYHGKGRLFLKHYADISGFFYQDLKTDRDWEQLVARKNDYDRILVDLPGLSSTETLSNWMEAECPGIARSIRFHLVLSPLYARNQQDAFVKRFQTPGTMSIIWTKLDEACTYGDLVNQSFTTGLPISLLAFGPGLRNTTAKASNEDVWRLLFKHQLPTVR
ncbi:flagellar biosynthesis protein FlhF [Desulfoplanes sp.]